MYVVKSSSVVLAAVVFLACGSFAQAESIAILNPSFESPTPLANTNDATGLLATPTSWTMVGANADDCGMFDLQQTAGPGPNVTSIPDGTQAIWGNRSYFYQVLGATVKANTTYTLTAYAGARGDIPFNWFGDPSPTIDLGYGNVYGANRLSAAASSCLVPAQGEWNLWSVTFETDANPVGLGQPLRVELNLRSIQPLFDNVQLTASTVPEPGMLALMATGLLGLLAYAWRKQQ